MKISIGQSEWIYLQRDRSHNLGVRAIVIFMKFIRFRSITDPSLSVLYVST